MFEVAGREVGTDRSFVVAEIGSNHGGDPELAHRLIEEAAWSGADAVKVQIRNNRELYTKAFFDRPYDSENAYGPTYGAHREHLELSPATHAELKQHAEDRGMVYFATAFDFSALDTCVDLGLPAIKIASGSITNTPLLAQASRTNLPLFVSTGGSHLTDVKRAVETVTAFNRNMCLMQATASYPCDADKLDLGVLNTYRFIFPACVLGYSSHFSGISDGPVAYMLGARVFEKHLTLSRTMKGTDHAFSLEPRGFKNFVRDIRRTEVMIGDGLKRRHMCEVDPIQKMAASVYARKRLKAGHVIQPSDICIKSPAAYIAPYEITDVVGCELIRDIGEEEPLEWEALVSAKEKHAV